MEWTGWASAGAVCGEVVLEIVVDQLRVDGDRRGGALPGSGNDLSPRVRSVAGDLHAGN